MHGADLDESCKSSVIQVGCLEKCNLPLESSAPSLCWLKRAGLRVSVHSVAPLPRCVQLHSRIPQLGVKPLPCRSLAAIVDHTLLLAQDGAATHKPHT